jgi:hypothetical protein
MWHVWGEKNSCRILVRKLKGKKPLGRPRSRCEGNMDLKEIIWEVVD